MNLAVKSMNEGEYPSSISGTWGINYKWKPPEENTIDFKIRIVNEEVNNSKRHKITSSIVKGKTVVCKQVHLYTGYNAREDETSDFNWKLLTDTRLENFKEIIKLFNSDSGKFIISKTHRLTKNKNFLIITRND